MTVTYVMIHSQTSCFSSLIIPASVPTSTSTPVESVNGAEGPTKLVIPVTIHADDNQDSSALYWPYQSGTSHFSSWSPQSSPGHWNCVFDCQFCLHTCHQSARTCYLRICHKFCHLCICCQFTPTCWWLWTHWNSVSVSLLFQHYWLLLWFVS